VHLVCLPRFLFANFKERAGRSQGFHNHVRDPKEAQGAVYSALKTGIAIACADNFNVQQGFKLFTNQTAIKHQIKIFKILKLSVKSGKDGTGTPCLLT